MPRWCPTLYSPSPHAAPCRAPAGCSNAAPAGQSGVIGLDAQTVVSAPPVDAPGAVALARTSDGPLGLLDGEQSPLKHMGGSRPQLVLRLVSIPQRQPLLLHGELNSTATDLAGYAVWEPRDQGYCPRVKWDAQEQCQVSEPGPHVQGGYLDATMAWDAGGQRGGTPKPGYQRHE